jgi:ATP-dependent Zn protease
MSALDNLLQAFETTGDLRLLGPALDLCADDAERARVLAFAAAAEPTAMDPMLRAGLARAALVTRDWTLAARLAEGCGAALAEEVAALLELGEPVRAESRYRAETSANPTIENPALLARIQAALAAAPEEASNILAFNRAQGRGAQAGPPDEAEVERSRLSFAESTSIGFAEVGGHDEVKRQIERRIIAPFQKPGLFARFRRKAGGGVLLYGPPGCGKTLLARATAGECRARFINVPVTDVLDKYIGEPERKLAAIFEDARRETPTVLFFDEIEALAGKRNSHTSQHEIGVVATFLAELDGFAQNNEGVLVLAATNMPWAVDPAFRRSGRFDRLLFVPPPDRGARAEILRIQLDGRPVEPGIELGGIVEKAAGFSGADLRNLVDTAADYAIEESVDQGNEVPIGKRHFTQALGEVKATTAEWLTTARNFAKYGNKGGQYDEVADFLKRFGQ